MSLLLRFFNLADQAGRAFGVARHLPPPAALIERAMQRTGLREIGDWQVETPLQVLLDAWQREARLNLFGRLGCSWDVTRFVSNLLYLQEAERRDPAIAQQPIAAPLFITGMPRSGTTFLFRLLAQDPENRVPRCWQTIDPYPLPRTAKEDMRARRVERQLRLFDRLAPEFAGAYTTMRATTPQECSEINAHLFTSYRFDTTHHVPSYRAWLDETSHVEAYRLHRRFLQHLQHMERAGARNGSGNGNSCGNDHAGHDQPGHWVLKCPDHIFALEALGAVYPDAHLVFCHRSPLKVLASDAMLTRIIREVFAEEVDCRAIGQQESERCHLAAQRIMAASRDARGWHGNGGSNGGIFHLRHEELTGDPIGTILRLYRHLGRSLSAGAEARMAALIRAQPNGGYSARRYTLEDYGLDPAQERRRFADYIDFMDALENPAVEWTALEWTVPERAAQERAVGAPHWRRQAAT
jgi:hypothetical protein